MLLPTTLVWHRRDLRLFDNALYSDLGDRPSLSVFVFDPSDFERRPSCAEPQRWSTCRCGPHATLCLLEALTDLRQTLRSHGSELLIRCGDPASVLPQLVF